MLVRNKQLFTRIGEVAEKLAEAGFEELSFLIPDGEYPQIQATLPGWQFKITLRETYFLFNLFDELEDLYCFDCVIYFNKFDWGIAYIKEYIQENKASEQLTDTQADIKEPNDSICTSDYC